MRRAVNEIAPGMLFAPRTPVPTLEAQARARNTDPVTSTEAAVAVERSGQAQRQRDEVLKLVRRYPGRTSAEIARIGRMERHQPARRLSELAAACLVDRGPARLCTVLSSRCVTWWPR